MRIRNRRIAAVITAAALMLCLASPAAAITRDNGDRPNAVPVVIDALFLRPAGLMMTMMGVLVYAVPVAPLVAITRPADLWKPLGPLVVAPARYTFSDPLGLHP